jgi:hypothetical protein
MAARATETQPQVWVSLRAEYVRSLDDGRVLLAVASRDIDADAVQCLHELLTAKFGFDNTFCELATSEVFRLATAQCVARDLRFE